MTGFIKLPWDYEMISRCATPGAVKHFGGRDALLRVRTGNPKPDAGHRVPTCA
jgi:hypothetical protein